MVNTYQDDAEPIVKIAEELRLIRCIMERQLSYGQAAGFVDYQMEKFGNAKTHADKKGEKDCQ